MNLEKAAKQYSEQNQFVSLTQCFKEVVNSEYVQEEKIKFALDVLQYLKAHLRSVKLDLLLINDLQLIAHSSATITQNPLLHVRLFWSHIRQVLLL